jgi:NifU-like protein involved in Fe-S cluster formation
MSLGLPPYSAEVLQLFRELPGAGALPGGGGAVAHGEAAALDQGAWVQFDARVADGRIADCRFRAFGCPHTLAAAALAARELRGRPLKDHDFIDAPRLAQRLVVPAAKMGRLLVVEDAVRALLADARRLE